MSARNHPDGEKVWIVYDERAMGGDSEDASVLESIDQEEATTDEEAFRMAMQTWRGVPFALFSYTFVDGKALQDKGNPIRVHRGESARRAHR